jgi:hypothetical protein
MIQNLADRTRIHENFNRYPTSKKKSNEISIAPAAIVV